MFQPIVANQLFSDDVLKGQGFLSRMLVSWPDSTTGKRSYVPENVYEHSAIKSYGRKMTTLLERKPRMELSKRNELDPHTIDMNGEAKSLWIKFHDYCDSEAADGKDLAAIRGLANKMPEHVLRIAGVLAVVDGLQSIPIELIERAISLGNYYLAEALRLEAMGVSDPDLLLAEKLLSWIQEKGRKLIYPALIYQKSIGALRNKEKATRIIKILEGHGWLTLFDEPREIDGATPAQIMERKPCLIFRKQKRGTGREALLFLLFLLFLRLKIAGIAKIAAVLALYPFFHRLIMKLRQRQNLSN